MASTEMIEENRTIKIRRGTRHSKNRECVSQITLCNNERSLMLPSFELPFEGWFKNSTKLLCR